MSVLPQTRFPGARLRWKEMQGPRGNLPLNSTRAGQGRGKVAIVGTQPDAPPQLRGASCRVDQDGSPCVAAEPARRAKPLRRILQPQATRETRRICMTREAESFLPPGNCR